MTAADVGVLSDAPGWQGRCTSNAESTVANTVSTSHSSPDLPNGSDDIDEGFRHDQVALARRFSRFGLLAAAADGDLTIMHSLLNDAVCAHQMTPSIFTAALLGRTPASAIAFLLETRAMSVDIRDGFGRTALHAALTERNKAMVYLLLSHGANAEADYLGYTPLSRAAANGSLEEIEWLLDAGVKIDAADSSGYTPLHRAAFEETGERALEFLLMRGADVEAEGVYGSPLHCAAYAGHPERVAMLLEAGADVMTRNIFGETPLSIVQLRWFESHKKLLHKQCGQLLLKTLKAWEDAGYFASLFSTCRWPISDIDDIG